MFHPNATAFRVFLLCQKTTPSTSEDALLVSDYLNGNEWALEKLINRHQQRIFNFVYSKVHCRDTTEDIFQDTFIKVIKTSKTDSITKKESSCLGLCE